MEDAPRRNTGEARTAGDHSRHSGAFIPYPVELVALERRQVLSPNFLQLLMLRRFADSETGVWETTTLDIARSLRVGRSTAQKLLTKAEYERYIHLRDHRVRTVRRTMHFGGFPQPEHTKLGLPPLRWDADFTPEETAGGSDLEQSPPVENSAIEQSSGSRKPETAGESPANGTARPPYGTYNVQNVPERVFNNVQNVPNVRGEPRTTNKDASGKDAVENPEAEPDLTPVSQFHPRSYEEYLAKDLAQTLGEQTINGFLSLRKRYGLKRLQRACGMAKEKLHDREHPIRERPGAYVWWLLQNDRC